MSVNHYDYNDSTQLSPHFNVKEFRCSCGKVHETLIASELVDKLEQLYSTLNCSKIIVTSGYRCPEHDKAVGGTSSGQHPKKKTSSVRTGDLSISFCLFVGCYSVSNSKKQTTYL